MTCFVFLQSQNHDRLACCQSQRHQSMSRYLWFLRARGLLDTDNSLITYLDDFWRNILITDGQIAIKFGTDFRTAVRMIG